MDTGDISDAVDDQTIRETIRDEYLRDSTVTIVLVGTETSTRKHVDWEIYSSMFDGRVNKKSGILVINLPTIDNGNVWAALGGEEKSIVYPDFNRWERWSTKAVFDHKFPYMPSRIVENLVSGATISVVGWNRLTVTRLGFLVDATFSQRARCQYDLRTPLRRRNSFRIDPSWTLPYDLEFRRLHLSSQYNSKICIYFVLSDATFCGDFAGTYG